MIKNNNNLDSLSKNLLNDVRSVLEGKSKPCKCDNNCSCGKKEKDEAEEKGEVKEAKKMKGEDPCWKDYKMVGTKKGKGGKEVPNCVPEETEVQSEAYNKDSVDKAIRRQKIGDKEAKLIHALLKGRTSQSSKLEEGEEKGGGYNAPTAKGAMTYKKVLGQHTVHKGGVFHRSFPSEGDAKNYIQKNQPKKTYPKVTAHPFHGMSEEVNEAKAESPIKGTRLISKHEGKDGHHAEVRHNPDYNEFQVHHYENGKHMGEGPVSYHDTKADAKETAEYEVKNYRPKGGSLRKEEVEVVDNEFNRQNYKHLIGKKFPKSKIPSYARVKEVSKTTKEEVELDEKLIGKQHKIDKNKNGKLDKQDFKMLRKEETIEEKLDASMGAGKYVTDFVKSKDPRFEGKTKKERIKMALGAYYSAKNEAVEIEEAAHGSKRDYAKHYIEVDGKYIATTTWARNAKEAEKRFLQAHPEHKGSRITISKD